MSNSLSVDKTLASSDNRREGQKVVVMKRYAKVVSGGRNFSFGAGIVEGVRSAQGDVCYLGFGRGKAKEVPDSIKKAMVAAKKNAKKIQLKNGTVLHQITARHGATTVIIRPSFDGGIVAGGAMRAVFEVLGVRNVTAKIIGSPNPINVVKATIKGLVAMAEPEQIADKRGKSLEDIVS